MIRGKVFKYGDNVETDVIIPARYLAISDVDELAKYCMEDIDEQFALKVKDGDVIVAKKNFGCGSSKEHAPLSIKAAGISCVIAATFARVFYRNAFNVGLPILESEEASEKIEYGDKVEVNLETGEIKNLTKKEVYCAQPFPEYIQEMMKKEGLVYYVKEGSGE